MVATPGLTVIDTPVFVIDLRYKQDRHFSTNRAFLDRIAKERCAATTIFNLLEVCGILSFNLNDKQLKELFHYFTQHYNVDVLPHSTLESPLPSLNTRDLFDVIAQKTSFGDALIIAAVERHIPGTARFVSWNALHFKGRLSVPAFTPREFLELFP
jgi:predicted nucleic acid-binding protein